MEKIAAFAKRVNIPEKLKVVVKFGYDKGLKKRLDKEGKDFDSYIQAVFTQTIAYFRHPSLGTEIEFEVSNTRMQLYFMSELYPGCLLYQNVIIILIVNI